VALSTLRLKDNRLATKEAGKALAAALVGNSVLTELDVSSNSWYNHSSDKGDGVGFVQELASGIKDNGALTKLVLKNNNFLTADGGKALSDTIAANTTLKELDVSNNQWHDNQRIEQGDGPGFAKSFAIGLSNNGALRSLDISNNSIGELVWKTGWRSNRVWDDELDELVYTHADGRKQIEKPQGTDKKEAFGVIALADAIKNNGALSTITVHKFPLPIQDIKTKVELDLSRKELNHLDAIIIAGLLPCNVSRTTFGCPCYR
jgi:Leucine-rich repeat (LRR) protein